MKKNITLSLIMATSLFILVGSADSLFSNIQSALVFTGSLVTLMWSAWKLKNLDLTIMDDED